MTRVTFSGPQIGWQRGKRGSGGRHVLEQDAVLRERRDLFGGKGQPVRQHLAIVLAAMGRGPSNTAMRPREAIGSFHDAAQAARAVVDLRVWRVVTQSRRIENLARLAHIAPRQRGTIQISVLSTIDLICALPA